MTCAQHTVPGTRETFRHGRGVLLLLLTERVCTPGSGTGAWLLVGLSTIKPVSLGLSPSSATYELYGSVPWLSLPAPQSSPQSAGSNSPIPHGAVWAEMRT